MKVKYVTLKAVMSRNYKGWFNRINRISEK